MERDLIVYDVVVLLEQHCGGITVESPVSGLQIMCYKGLVVKGKESLCNVSRKCTMNYLPCTEVASLIDLNH